MCIVFILQINLASFRVPTILNISGSCLAGFINLTWNSPTVWKENSLELWFGRNSTHFYLWRITAKVFQDSKHFTSLTDFPHYENFSGDYLSDYYMQFATPIGHSFTCNGVVVFNGLNRWESVSFNGPRFEAFREGLPGRREFSPGKYFVSPLIRKKYSKEKKKCLNSGVKQESFRKILLMVLEEENCCSYQLNLNSH